MPALDDKTIAAWATAVYARMKSRSCAGRSEDGHELGSSQEYCDQCIIEMLIVAYCAGRDSQR